MRTSAALDIFSNSTVILYNKLTEVK